MGTLGQYQTYSVYTLPSATSAVITKYDSSSVSLSYNGQYTSVGIVRNDVQVALISGSNVTNTTYTDYSGVLGNTLYNYGVIPYNANIPPLAGAQINVSNNPITTLANLVPSLGKTTANSIQVMFGGQYSYVYVYLNGVYASMITNDVSYTFSTIPSTSTSLTTDTSYVVTLKPFNYKDVSGSVYSALLCTAPLLTSLDTGFITSTTMELNFTGIYSYFKIFRNGSMIYANSTKTYDTSYTDTGLVSNTNYALQSTGLFGCGSIDCLQNDGLLVYLQW